MMMIPLLNLLLATVHLSNMFKALVILVVQLADSQTELQMQHFPQIFLVLTVISKLPKSLFLPTIMEIAYMVAQTDFLELFGIPTK